MDTPVLMACLVGMVRFKKIRHSVQGESSRPSSARECFLATVNTVSELGTVQSVKWSDEQVGNQTLVVSQKSRWTKQLDPRQRTPNKYRFRGIAGCTRNTEEGRGGQRDSEIPSCSGQTRESIIPSTGTSFCLCLLFSLPRPLIKPRDPY